MLAELLKKVFSTVISKNIYCVKEVELYTLFQLHTTFTLFLIFDTEQSFIIKGVSRGKKHYTQLSHFFQFSFYFNDR